MHHAGQRPDTRHTRNGGRAPPGRDPRLRVARTGRPGHLRAAGALLGVLASAAIGLEIRTAHLQAVLVARLASELRYEVVAVEAAGSGDASSVRGSAEGPAPPGSPTPSQSAAEPISLLAPERRGPYDHRLGYAALPDTVTRLRSRGFVLTRRARPSPALRRLARWGLSPPYREKAAAGLRIEDTGGEVVFEARHPARRFSHFDEIPRPILEALLFLENRELLAPGADTRNPALEWDRFTRAVVARAGFALGVSGRGPGGSTLATQIEKYRHSPSGITGSSAEKLRQIASASLRSYLDGPDTRAARRRIAIDYLNTMPLAARPGFGEVFGLGDGLWAWYGRDLDEVRALLAEPATEAGRADDAAAAERRARVLKEAVSLLVAVQRPSHHLIADRAGLRAATDQALHQLQRAGVLGAEWAETARAAPLRFRGPGSREPAPAAGRAATHALRAELAELVGPGDLYTLERLDLTAATTLDAALEAEIRRLLARLREPQGAAAAGLRAPGLLEQGDPGDVAYSVLLLERGAQGHRVRVHVDTLAQPFDPIEEMKLDLGSTAKLRTLVHYLQLVADLHARYAGAPPALLAALPTHPTDAISRFALARLRADPELPLAALVTAALERRYDASGGEVFFTGGGLHRFHNFDGRYEGRRIALRTAFRHSVNLPFVRLMRDIVRHVLYRPGPRGPAVPFDLLERGDHPARRKYLERFADYEGRIFLDRFLARHRGGGTGGDDAEPRSGSEGHPLERWLLRYLADHPGASREEVMTASAGARQEAYRWLFRTSRKSAQDRRIRILLEREAFAEIHSAWAELGYPFPRLVPSLATAIGVSADRPAALAEVLGIIAADGLRRPRIRIEELRFAEGTPYETHLRRGPVAGERVVPPEVAAALRGLLGDVVERGTARRAAGAFEDHAAPGPPEDRGVGRPRAVFIGGKTGTGDNRRVQVGPRGHVLASQATSRTATFAFLFGKRFFGVVTAHVTGPESEGYAFTSSLPVQVFRLLAPSFARLVATDSSAGAGPETRAAGDASAHRAARDRGHHAGVSPATAPADRDRHLLVLAPPARRRAKSPWRILLLRGAPRGHPPRIPGALAPDPGAAGGGTGLLAEPGAAGGAAGPAALRAGPGAGARGGGGGLRAAGRRLPGGRLGRGARGPDRRLPGGGRPGARRGAPRGPPAARVGGPAGGGPLRALLAPGRRGPRRGDRRPAPPPRRAPPALRRPQAAMPLPLLRDPRRLAGRRLRRSLGRGRPARRGPPLGPRSCRQPSLLRVSFLRRCSVIVQGHEIQRPLRRRTRTLIVGSGAGGAVVAQILAAAGEEVVVLEEGGRFTARDFTQREDEMFPALYRGGGQQLSHDGTINVLQGSCYGGSTVINMADCVPTPPEVYAHWRRLLGITALDERSLEPSLRRVWRRLGVNRIHRAQVNRNNAAVLRGARSLGLSAGVFDHNRTGCIGSGYCLIGCAYDAKKGAHLNYLPAAVEAGAEVYTEARVERLERSDAGRWVARGDVVERGSRVARLPLRVEADRVVLAAGAVHSPAILARSGLGRGLPQLGRNLSLQPQMGVVAPMDREIELWRGIPQSAFCDAHDHNTAEAGLGGFRLEGVHGGIAQAAGLIPGFGRAHKEAMAELPRTATALLLVPDRPSGELAWRWRRDGRGVVPTIRYWMRQEWKARLRRGLRHAAELYFAAGAKRVLFPSELFPALESPDDLPRLEHFPIAPHVTYFVSAHVQGTCRMAPDPRRGVVDEDHRVHGIPDLYVVDASVMPTTASTHTMIPIMTLADRAAHRMLEPTDKGGRS